MADQDQTTNTGDDGKPPAGGDDQDKGTGGNSKTFTQDDVDKIVTERLAKADKKAEERTAKAIADALAEQERKANMSAEEKAKEESKKKSEELDGKERNLALRENRADARELLQEKKIPTELVDYVVDVDSDKTKSNIENLEKVWNKAIEEGVKAKLSGKTPEDFSGDDKSKGGEQKTSNGGTVIRSNGKVAL